MSETPVLLTASMAKEWAGLLAQSGASIPGDLPDGVNAFVRSLLAIASEATVCIEAERLARWEEALRKIADAPNAKFDLDSVSKDFASGMLKAFGAAATIARAAIPEQPASQSPNVEYVLVEDMVEGSHPQYGRGLFTTYNCVKTGIAREALAAQEVGNG